MAVSAPGDEVVMVKPGAWAFGCRTSLLRARDTHEDNRVTFVELFFDLVFVFAVTQLSHGLLEHLTPQGLLQMMVLLMAVWWGWIDTSWVTNWLDPQQTAVRVMLFRADALRADDVDRDPARLRRARSGLRLRLRGHAGRSDDLHAVGARVIISAGELPQFSAHRRVAFRGRRVLGRRRARRGRDADAALDRRRCRSSTLSPSVGFYVPGLGRSTTADWDVEGGHLAERCGLFVIIALGELVLVTGATFAGIEWNGPTVAAFLTAFIGSVAMWWIYFNIGAERGSQQHRALRRSRPAGAARLHLFPHRHRRRHHLLRRQRRDHPDASARPCGAECRRRDPRGAGGLSGRQCSVQAGDRRADSAVASDRSGAARRPLACGFILHMPPLALGAAASAALVVVALWETVSLSGWQWARKEPAG